MFNEEEDDKNPLDDITGQDDEDEDKEAEDPLEGIGLGDDEE